MSFLRLPLNTASPLPAPGLRHGRYPQRRAGDGAGSRVEALWRRLRSLTAPGARTHLRSAERIRATTPAHFDDAQRAALCQALRRSGLDAGTREQALALVAAAAHETLGLHPHRVQLAAAHALLCGTFAEMATGEGKTLVVALAAACAAQAGTPVHGITANDYLVSRDAAEMTPLYARLGLRVGTVCEGDGVDARRAAYASDITYVTSRELAFDYLRDSVLVPFEPDRLTEMTRAFAEPGRIGLRVLRGLCMAIVDEADSALIDEACMPLVLARPQASATDGEALAAVLACARKLTPITHFGIERGSTRVELSAAGHAVAATLGSNTRLQASRLQQALAALHVYARDRHYVVRDGQVHIVDPHTGRIADKRAWSQELHRFIELKEGCALGTENVTAAQITYQRFFPRYLQLAGVSGTLRECASELATVYDRHVVRLPTHKPLQRTLARPQVFPDRDAMWSACVERARAVAAAGRAVLIGTDSVLDSRALSARLHAAGLAHTVLDALQDADEAAIVAGAGQPGRITISTRMAGRGTDIRLHPAVRDAGGLHVICCQHNSTARTDRQLMGRCARQGDPGSAEHYRALDADGVEQWLPAPARRMLTQYLSRVPAPVAASLFRFGQYRLESRERHLRAAMLRAEHLQHRRSAYRGPGL
jgi:preprotein translocase subunit SecA